MALEISWFFPYISYDRGYRLTLNELNGKIMILKYHILALISAIALKFREIAVDADAYK